MRTDNRAWIAPDGLAEPKDHAGRVAAGGREVRSEQRVACGRVRAGGGCRGRAERSRPVPYGCRSQHTEDDQAERERRDRVGDDASRRASPPAEASGALGRVRRPEHGPAEDGQQGRQQGEPSQQHQRYGDGQRGAEAGVEPEGGQHQGKQRGDDGGGGEGDRPADTGESVRDGIVGSAAGAELLSHPEDQEQAVIRAGAEGEDKQQDLGERRHLQPRLARLCDHRTGELGDQNGRGQGQQRRQQRAEHDEQQQQDERDRQVLAEVARPMRGLARIDLRGHRTGHVGVQVAGQGGGLNCPAETGDKLPRGALGVEVDTGLDLQLARRPIATDSQVPDLPHVGDPGEPGPERFYGGQVGGGERAVAPGDNDRHRGLARPLERCGEPGGLQAGAARWHKAGIAGIGDARQRGEEVAGQNRRGDPRDDDGPSETDGEPPGGGEEPRHEEVSSQLGGFAV